MTESSENRWAPFATHGEETRFYRTLELIEGLCVVCTGILLGLPAHWYGEPLWGDQTFQGACFIQVGITLTVYALYALPPDKGEPWMTSKRGSGFLASWVFGWFGAIGAAIHHVI